VRRVAVLGDVHGNAVALRAVLAEVAREDLDAVVWTGDLSWGWQPRETLDLVRSVRLPALYVRGNAERALLELAAGTRAEPTERDLWMLGRHDEAQLSFARSFEEQVSVDVDGPGPTRFCHGSPRGDNECLTAETSAERITEAMNGVSERILVTGHTHCQYDREIAGVRSINPGSVGMPYEGRPGAAFWAVLGPDVELRSTEYSLDEAVAAVRATDDPAKEQMVEMLTSPASPAEVIEHAERVQFSD
jgi:predicted phosphodiesterase